MANNLDILDPNSVSGNGISRGGTPLEELTVFASLKVKFRNINDIEKFGTFREIEFIEGSKRSDGKKVFTTNFTEVGTDFGKNNTLETLGIKSIDITFNPDQTPIISINFVDVRGDSILTKEGEGKFGFFFRLPYPIFELTIKGYYGKPVTYCLHMTKWNSKFNDSNGSFEVNTEFIGYTFAFLSDMLLGYLSGIVETEEGRDIFNQKSQDALFYSNKTGMVIPTITQFIEDAYGLDKNLEQIKTTKEYKQLTKILGLKSALVQLRNKLISGLNDITSYYGATDKPKKPIINTISETLGKNPNNYKSLYVFSYNNKNVNKTYKELIKLFESLKTSLDTINDSEIPNKYTIKSDVLNLKNSSKFAGYNSSYYIANEEITVEKSNIITFSQTDNEGVENTIKSKKPKQTIKNVCIVDVTNFIKQYKDVLSLIDFSLKNLKENLSISIKNEFNKSFNGFNPTIENFFLMLSVHIETFMETLKKLGEDISSPNSNRSILKRLRDEKRLLDVSQKEGDPIGPFPILLEETIVNEDKIEEWLGFEDAVAPEVIYVENLLRGIISARSRNEEITSNEGNDIFRWVPVNPMDMPIPTFKHTTNPYLTLDTYDDFRLALSLRAITFILSDGLKDEGQFKTDLKNLARLEANNIFSLRKRHPKIHTLLSEGDQGTFTDFIVTSLTTNYSGYDNGEGYTSVLTEKPEAKGKYTYTYIDDGKQNVIPFNGNLTIASIKKYKTDPNYLSDNKYNYINTYKSTNEGGFIIVNGNDYDSAIDNSNINNPTYLNDDTIKYKDYITDKGLDLFFIHKGIDLHMFNSSTVSLKNMRNFVAPKIDVLFRRPLLSRNYDKCGPLLGKGIIDINFFFYIDHKNETESNIKPTAGTIIGQFDNIDTVLKPSDYTSSIPYSAGFYGEINDITDKYEFKITDNTNNSIETSDTFSFYNDINENTCVTIGESHHLYSSALRNHLSEGKPTFIEDFLISNCGPTEDDINQRKMNTLKKGISLFGSEFYNKQTDSIAKSLLFLSSLPFNLDETYLNKILKEIMVTSGSIKIPKAMLLLIGGLLWRSEQNEDPIKWYRKTDGSLTNDINESDSKNGSTILSIITPSSDSETIIPPTKTQALYTKAIYQSTFDFANNISTTKPLGFTFKSTDPDNPGYYDIPFLNESTFIKKKLIEKFLYWSDETNKSLDSWSTIRNELEIGITEFASSLSYTTEQAWDDLYEKYNLGVENKKRILKNYFVFSPIKKTKEDDENEEKYNYNNKNFLLKLRPNTQINRRLLNFLLEYDVLVISNKNIWEEKDVEPTFDATLLRNEFFPAFKEEYDRLTTVEREAILNTSDPENILDGNDDDKIKLNLYRNIKAIFDKWVGASTIKNESDVLQPKCVFDYENPFISRFRFIDKYFNNVGDKIFIQPESVVNRLTSNLNESSGSIISLLLSDMNFDFFPLPTYIDYTNEDEKRKVFEPLTIGETDADSLGPMFICMYSNNRSKHLNYENDKFGNKNDALKLDSGKFNLDANIATLAFKVAYGSQNQSHFKNFNLDQSEFSETDESLFVQDSLVNKNSSTRSSSFIGQNIFNIYSTRSYTCEVTSLGNMMIQPMMYFSLENIPLFNGAYCIHKVNHSITPNNVETKFRGVRLANNDVPYFKDNKIFLSLLDSITGDLSIDQDITDIEVAPTQPGPSPRVKSTRTDGDTQSLNIPGGGNILHNYADETIITNIESIVQSAYDVGVTNPYAIVGVLSVVGKESQFAPKSESSYKNTSTERIKEVFGEYDIWRRLPNFDKNIDAEIDKLKQNDQKFFDYVYGKDSTQTTLRGLGNVNEGDGYKYRGRGFNQLTGKANYQNIENLIKEPIVNNPDLVNRVDIAGKTLFTYLVNGFKTVRREDGSTPNMNEFKSVDEAIKDIARLNAGWGYGYNASNVKNAINLAKQIEPNFTIVI